jgi:hypothetical protein
VAGAVDPQKCNTGQGKEKECKGRKPWHSWVRRHDTKAPHYDTDETYHS